MLFEDSAKHSDHYDIWYILVRSAGIPDKVRKYLYLDVENLFVAPNGSCIGKLIWIGY